MNNRLPVPPILHMMPLEAAVLLLGLLLLPACAPMSIQGTPVAFATLPPTAQPGTSPTAVTTPRSPTATAQPVTSPRPTLSTTSSTPTSTRPATPVPTTTIAASASLGPTELRYRLIDQLGKPFFCDPDLYPVARVLDPQEFEKRFQAIVQNSEEFQAILKHNAISNQANLTSDQKHLVYSESKMLNAIQLQPNGAVLNFTMRVAEDKTRGNSFEGTINAAGAIVVTRKQSTILTCPICLSAGTVIDTPSGLVPIQDIRQGMPVWTTDVSGTRTIGVVSNVVERPVPPGTNLTRLVLADGRAIVVSPGHPTGDERIIADLALGDVLNGATVVAVQTVAYDGAATFDLLPSGETGEYWANGILLQSTLTR